MGTSRIRQLIAPGLLVVVVMVVLIRCSDSSDPMSAATIGPAGGTVTSADRVLQVRIPPGALSSDVQITINEITSVPPGTLGKAYELGPDGTTFAMPIALEFVVPSGVDKEGVTIATLENGVWQPLPMPALGSSSVIAPTDHFSVWGLYYGIRCNPSGTGTGETRDCGVPDAPLGPDGPTSLDAFATGETAAAGDPGDSRCAPFSCVDGNCGFPCRDTTECARGLYCVKAPGAGLGACRTLGCSGTDKCPASPRSVCNVLKMCVAPCGAAGDGPCPAGEVCANGTCAHLGCAQPQAPDAGVPLDAFPVAPAERCPQGSRCVYGVPYSVCIAMPQGCRCGDPGCDCGGTCGSEPLDAPLGPDGPIFIDAL